METFFAIFKKFVVGMVFVVFGMTMVYVPHHIGHYDTVPEAHAGGVFVDFVNLVQNTASAIADTAISIVESAFNLKEFTLDGIAWAIAKQIVSNMVSSLVDWINSGFQGSPAFVQDLGGFLLQAADEEFGKIIEEVAPFICSPFRLDVQIAVAIEYDQSRTREVPTCTLSGVFENFEAFIDGQFSEGGWNDWFKITSNPAVYTEYGSVLTVKQSARARVINARGEELNILSFGDGFLSGKVCQNVTGPDGVTEECAISKPGKTIADSLNKALGAGQDTLVTADEISEIIAALLGQLANKAITGAAGLLGLSGGTGYTYRGYSRGSFAEELRNGATAGQTGGVDTSTGVPTGGGTANPGDITFAAGFILDSLAKQRASLTKIDDYIIQLQGFINYAGNTAENRVAANVFLTEANNYRTSLTREISQAAPIVDEYIVLETEYTDPNTTVERKIEIRGLQSEVIQRFNAVGLTNPATLESVFTRWDGLLAQNLAPRVLPACYVDENFDGVNQSWEIDTDCNGITDLNEINPCGFNGCQINPFL